MYVMCVHVVLTCCTLICLLTPFSLLNPSTPTTHSPPQSPQPLDAMGAVAEGGLLASLQVPWIAKRTAAAATLALATVLGAAHAGVGLLGLWVGTKLLNVGTLALDLQHLQAGDTPMGPMQVLGSGMRATQPRSMPERAARQRSTVQGTGSKQG